MLRVDWYEHILLPDNLRMALSHLTVLRRRPTLRNSLFGLVAFGTLTACSDDDTGPNGGNVAASNVE